MEYKSLSRLIYLAAGLLVALWFLHEVLQVILLLFFAIVITIVLNAPVTWLEGKNIRRPIGSLIVFFTVLLCFALLGWMIVPKLVTQVRLLITNLPAYLENLNARIEKWLGEYGGDRQSAKDTASAITALPSVSTIINSVGQYSIQLFKNLLLIIFFFCLVIYMLINPRPLLELYLSYFSDRQKGQGCGSIFLRVKNDYRLDVVKYSCRRYKGSYRLVFSLFYGYPGSMGLGCSHLFCGTDPQNWFLYYGRSSHIDRFLDFPYYRLVGCYILSWIG